MFTAFILQYFIQDWHGALKPPWDMKKNKRELEWSILIRALPTLSHKSKPSLTNFYNYSVISDTTKDSHFHVVSRFVIQISREKLSFAWLASFPKSVYQKRCFHEARPNKSQHRAIRKSPCLGEEGGLISNNSPWFSQLALSFDLGGDPNKRGEITL